MILLGCCELQALLHAARDLQASAKPLALCRSSLISSDVIREYAARYLE